MVFLEAFNREVTLAKERLLSQVDEADEPIAPKRTDCSDAGTYARTDLLAQEVLERTNDNKLQRKQSSKP
jgi:hypothetical protein